VKPDQDPSWNRYPQTILEMLEDRSLVIDLRREIAHDTRRSLSQHGFGTGFVVLTAWNPHGRSTDEATNRGRDRELREWLGARHIRWVPADGVSPDGEHREEGVAAVMSVERGRELAVRYQQSAIYAYDGSVMWLLGALVTAPPLPLPAHTPAGL
jgi:uncharacterized protein DUF3293